MRKLLWMFGVSVWLTGCYTAASAPVDAPADAPPPIPVRRVCTDASQCLPGEGCRLFPYSGPDRVCALPCEESNSRCPNGQLCYGFAEAACYPGADPAHAATPCVGFLDCPAGYGCSVVGDATLPGSVCRPADCDTNADCERGFACGRGHTCNPVCHPLDTWTCPEGSLCMGGRCRELDAVRDCDVWVMGTPIPDNCPLGTICLGSDDTEFRCETPIEFFNRSSCRADQAQIDSDCVDRRTR